MSLVKFRRRFPLFESGVPIWFDTEEWLKDPFFTNGKTMPAMNVKETDDLFEFELAIPGFKKDQIEVALEDDELHVTASKETEETTEEEGYTRKEFSFNEFERRIPVPANVNLKKEVKANYDNGVLHIMLKKLDKTIEHPKKKIAIK